MSNQLKPIGELPGPEPREPGSQVGDIVSQLVEHPGQWFEIGALTQKNYRTSMYAYAGRYHTPLELVVRKGVLYGRWKEHTE